MKYIIFFIISFLTNMTFAGEVPNWHSVYQYKPKSINSNRMVSFILKDNSLFIPDFSTLYKVSLNTGELAEFPLNRDFDVDPQIMKAPKEGFYYMDFVNENVLFVSYENDKGIRIWDPSLTKLLEVMDNPCGEQYPYRISPNNKFLSCGSKLYSLSTQQIILNPHVLFVHNSGFSTDKYFFYFSRENNNADSSAFFYDINNQMNYELKHEDLITYAYLSKHSNVLALATKGSWFKRDKLYVYHLPNTQRVLVDTTSTEGLIISPDGEYILVSNSSGVNVYKNIKGTFVKHKKLPIQLHMDGINNVSYEKSSYTTMIFATKDKALFLTQSGDLQLWNIDQGTLIHSIGINKTGKTALRFLYQPENNYVVVQWKEDYMIDVYKISVGDK